MESSQPSSKRKTYGQCCCCSLGTATTIWASLQIVLAVFQLIGGYSSGPVFAAGAAVGLLTAFLQLAAAVQQNALAAYMAFYLQIMTLLLWIIQFFFIVAFFVHSCTHKTGKESRVSLARYIIGYDFPKHRAEYAHIAVSGFVFFMCLLILYVGFFVASFFILRLLWSFYRVLQAGGTSFEYKTAEDIESALLRAQLPAMTNYSATEELSPEPSWRGTGTSGEDFFHTRENSRIPFLSEGRSRSTFPQAVS